MSNEEICTECAGTKTIFRAFAKNSDGSHEFPCPTCSDKTTAQIVITCIHSNYQYECVACHIIRVEADVARLKRIATQEHDAHREAMAKANLALTDAINALKKCAIVLSGESMTKFDLECALKAAQAVLRANNTE